MSPTSKASAARLAAQRNPTAGVLAHLFDGDRSPHAERPLSRDPGERQGRPRTCLVLPLKLGGPGR
jgi:hypothetical protein